MSAGVTFDVLEHIPGITCCNGLGISNFDLR